MSDHPREAHRHLKKLKVCDDVWLSIFPFFEPAELGMKLALLSDRFDALVELHFKTRKFTIGTFQIHNSNCRSGVVIATYNIVDLIFMKFPIPEAPAPDNLIGFGCIYIRCTGLDSLDQTLAASFRHIRSLFKLGITLELDISDEKQKNFAVLVKEFWPLMATNISKLIIGNLNYVVQLRNYISPTFLHDCVNLRAIGTAEGLFFCDLPATPEEVSAEQAVFEWLHTPFKSGIPKMIKGDFTWTPQNFRKMEELKKTFLYASSPVSYIISRCVTFGGVEPFELENERTQERLTYSRRKLRSHVFRLLVRGPIVRDEKWAEWELEAMEAWTTKNKIYISYL
uniref:Uncharacterized protein n=1 Tax=Globodera rostochiensis TaxID=31243 RepID=A0A914GX57_GLORO